MPIFLTIHYTNGVPGANSGKRGETMKIVLLVTWIVSGQAPSSYQVEFDSWQKCEAARQALLKDRERINESIGAVIAGPGVFRPMVSVVCVTK